MNRLFISTGFLLLTSVSFSAESAVAVDAAASSPPTVPDLPILDSPGWGPCMDAVVQGDHLFAIGRGKLYTADISDPEKPRLLGTLSGLGNTRQLVVGKGVAYVSAREDGLFVVDVQDPTKPALLNHYDTIELATGLDLAGDVLFIAQRHYGVEQVDVSDPRQPRHLSSIRTGEAQSIAYHDGYLYTGVWGTSEIVTLDMTDARSPKILSKVPLDGYGDGVTVHGGYLYAATGHHSRAPHAAEGDPGYGHGHGLEIFDLSDPAKPSFVSRVKFPPFYGIGNDMWSVSVVNGHAFVADTHNGIFVVDVRDPQHPSIVGRSHLPVPTGKDVPAFYGGLAVGDGVIYGAGGWTDLHVLAAPGLASPVASGNGTPPTIRPVVESQNERILSSYHPQGQVHAVAPVEDLPLAVAACGSAGLHVIRLTEDSIQPVSVTATTGFATDVCLLGHTVYAAEGTGGLSIWELSPDGRLTKQSAYQVPGRGIRFVAVPAPGKYALVEVGAGQLHIVDVSDPTQPSLTLQDSHLGLFYGYQLLDSLVDGRYTAAFWHVDGIHWYDLSTHPPRLEGAHPAGRFGMAEGLVRLGESHGQKLLAPYRGGLISFDFEETRPITELPIHRIEGVHLRGKPTLDETRHHLYLADRVLGGITILNLTTPDNPAVLDSFTTPGNPGRIAPLKNGYLLPNGNQGLFLLAPPEAESAR